MYIWAVPLLIASHLWLQDYRDSKLAGYAWFISNSLLLYVPGMVWLVLLNAIWQRAAVKQTVLSYRSWWGRLAVLVTGLLCVSPLLYGLAVGQAITISLTLLGLPTAMPHLTDLLLNLRDAVLFVAIRGQAPTDLWLNHLPMLDAFMTVLCIIGAYFYGQHWRASRTRLLGSFLVVGLLLIAAGGSVTIGLLVPLLYLIAAAGIAYLLHLWLVVFPRNPLARGFGIGLVSVAVAVSCMYSLRQYFVAWPHHPATGAAFHEHKIISSHR